MNIVLQLHLIIGIEQHCEIRLMQGSKHTGYFSWSKSFGVNFILDILFV